MNHPILVWWGMKADWGILLISFPTIFGTRACTQNIKHSACLWWESLTETWSWTNHVTEPQLEQVWLYQSSCGFKTKNSLLEPSLHLSHSWQTLYEQEGFTRPLIKHRLRECQPQPFRQEVERLETGNDLFNGTKVMLVPNVFTI